MSGTFGGSIKLTGESAYRQALKNITQSLREVSSELKLTATQYDSNDKSITNLKNKQQALSDTLKKQASIVESTRNTYDKFKAKVEEQAKAHEELEQKYKGAQEELEKIKNTSGEASQEYKDQKVKVEQLASAVGKSATANNENELALSKLKIKLNEAESAYDTTERQINELNEELKKAQNEYNQSQSSLSKLTSTIEEQENEVRKLKEAYKNASLNGNKEEAERLAKSIKSLSSELNENKVKMESLDKSADDLDGSLKDVGDSAESSSDGFTVMKGALADLASKGIETAVSSLKDFATDAVNAYSQFSAQTGIATDKMGDYQKAIDNVYKSNFGDSLQDVAEKMGKVKEVTGELDSSKLEDMTEKVMTLEDVFGMDMTESVRGAQSLVNHFGLTSEQAFDLLASGAQNGLNYTDELGDNVSEYAGKFAEAGYSADEYFQLLQNGSQGGAYNLDKVNDAINEVTTRLGDGTIEESLGMFDKNTQNVFKAWQDGKATQKDVIEAIVKDIKGTKSQQDQLNKSAKAFGTMAEDGGTKFISSLTSVGKTYDDVNGKADELANVKYDTPMSALKGLGRTIQTDLLKPIMNDLMPYINQAVAFVQANLPQITSVLKTVGGAIKSVLDVVILLSPAIAGIGTALAVLEIASFVSNMGGLVATLSAAIQSTKLFTLAQAALDLVMNASTIGLVVAAIAGLVVAFTIAWNKSEGFRNFWIGLWEGIKTTVSTVVGAISSFLSSAWSAISATITTVWNAIASVISTVWDGIKTTITTVINVISSVISSVFNAIKAVITTVWNGISSVTSTVWNGIKTAISTVINGIKSVITSVFNAVKNTVTTVWNGIKSVTSTVWNAIKTAVSTPVNAIKSVVTSVWNGIKSTTTSVWNGIKNAISSPMNSAKNLVKGIIDSIKGFFKFKITWPHIPLPHFSIKPKGWGVDDLLKGKIPTLGITWHAQGGVFDRGATVLRGIGENGAEAVVPLERNTYWIKRVADEMRGYIIDAISMPKINVEVPNKSENITDTSYNKLVDAFKDALSSMKVELDDEEMGKFVDRTVTKAIYQ